VSTSRDPAQIEGPPSRQKGFFQEIISHPGHLVRRSYQIFSSVFEEEMAGLNLTPIQYIILAVLEVYPGIDQTRLGGLAAIDKSSCGRAVEKLAQRKLILVRFSSEDRRQRELHLSEKGSALLSEAVPAARRIRKRLFSTLSPAQQTQFLASLAAFVDANNEASRAPFSPPD
jgi:MarR family transcriptional regulator, lower aerobic nicotinate degradation pathway regulator